MDRYLMCRARGRDGTLSNGIQIEGTIKKGGRRFVGTFERGAR
jgi:hypothetical protein